MTITPCASLPEKLVVTTLDPAGVSADKVKFFERVRRTMFAKAILGMLKPTAVTTVIHTRELFRYKDGDEDTHDDGQTLLKLIFF